MDRATIVAVVNDALAVAETKEGRRLLMRLSDLATEVPEAFPRYADSQGGLIDKLLEIPRDAPEEDQPEGEVIPLLAKTLDIGPAR